MLFHSCPLPVWAPWLFVTLMGLACYSDLYERKISNTLNGTLILSGLVLQIWAYGIQGVLYGALGSFSALFLLIGPFALHLYKGGDVKLCIGFGAWIGGLMVGYTILGGIILGGLFGFLIAFQHRLSHSSDPLPTVPMAFPFCISCISFLLIWGWPSFESVWG